MTQLAPARATKRLLPSSLRERRLNCIELSGKLVEQRKTCAIPCRSSGQRRIAATQIRAQTESGTERLVEVEIAVVALEANPPALASGGIPRRGNQCDWLSRSQSRTNKTPCCM